ncbi:hypothetical protein QWJ07_31065 [Frankia sp. RB7]|nr:hypothetical protein [Frankia sp. RB7]
MLTGDPAGDRKQPAREQAGIEHERGQDRQREAEARHRHQDKLPPPRQRQEIERGQQREEDQLERHHESEQRRPSHTKDVIAIIWLRRAKQKRKCYGRQSAAQDREIARGQHPFEANERAEHVESPQRHVTQAACPADPGQHQATEHGDEEKDAAVMADEKAARAQRTKGVQRRRQIGIRELGALQILHVVRIEPVDMRIDGGAVDANVPAVIRIERGIVGEIAEHQHRHQRDQAGKPDVALAGRVGRRSRPSCCSGDVGHV